MTLQLARTRGALAALDGAGAAVAGLDGTEPAEHIESVLAREDAAKVSLGEAFAADTADRNDPATARRVGLSLAGQRWLRGLVERAEPRAA